MRFSAMLGALLMASASAQSVGKALPNREQKMLDGMIARLPGSDGKTRHGKGKQAKPAKRSNRGNVSARVRRKHRRAA